MLLRACDVCSHLHSHDGWISSLKWQKRGPLLTSFPLYLHFNNLVELLREIDPSTLGNRVFSALLGAIIECTVICHFVVTSNQASLLLMNLNLVLGGKVLWSESNDANGCNSHISCHVPDTQNMYIMDLDSATCFMSSLPLDSIQPGVAMVSPLPSESQDVR